MATIEMTMVQTRPVGKGVGVHEAYGAARALPMRSIISKLDMDR